jgi:protein TonB
LALAATLVLFWFMQYLVLPDDGSVLSEPPPRFVDFVRLKPEVFEPEPEPEEPEPEPEELPPMPPQLEPVTPEPPPPELQMVMPKLSLSPIKADAQIMNGLVQAEEMVAIAPAPPPPEFSKQSDLIPLVRIEPRYPSRAARRGIEGWVKLEFTITEDGTVDDVKVVEAEPSRIFDRAAKRAVRKWRFRPRVVDGAPVARSAVQVLKFQLRKGKG